MTKISFFFFPDKDFNPSPVTCILALASPEVSVSLNLPAYIIGIDMPAL